MVSGSIYATVTVATGSNGRPSFGFAGCQPGFTHTGAKSCGRIRLLLTRSRHHSPRNPTCPRNARQLDVAVGLTKPTIESAKNTYEQDKHNAERHSSKGSPRPPRWDSENTRQRTSEPVSAVVEVEEIGCGIAVTGKKQRTHPGECMRCVIQPRTECDAADDERSYENGQSGGSKAKDH